MLFTSESVTSGHPDKICDQVSDAILDEAIKQDPKSKVAIDTWVKDNNLGLIGEIKTKAKLDFEKIARQTVLDIGYNHNDLGFNGNTFKFWNFVGRQTAEISEAVEGGQQIGAGDQGIMFGFATKETKELMPLPILMAQKLAQKLEFFRKSELETKGESILRPDGKTQVTIEYQNNQPKSIHTILISTQHIPKVSQLEVKTVLEREIIQKVLQENQWENLKTKTTKIIINPSGSFVEGGPKADSGMTGRKIVVDSYGGWGRSGGGAFSGKDYTKVDRSAAYMARFLARQIIKKNWADEVEIQLSYAIGKPKPISINLQGKLNKEEQEIIKFIEEKYDLTPDGIVSFLKLDKPIYKKTATYGHFGRKSVGGFFQWEA